MLQMEVHKQNKYSIFCANNKQQKEKVIYSWFFKPTRTALHTSISLVHMISKMQMVLIKLNQVSTP